MIDLKMIDLKLYILPILSITSFLLAIFYPLFSIFLIIASFFFLFIYLYYPNRNRYSDMLLAGLLVSAIIYSPTIGLFYIPIVFIPISILFLIREKLYHKSLNYSYLPVVLSPIVVMLVTIVLVFFIDDSRKALHDWILQFFTDFTTPAKNTLERFDNNGTFTYIMNNKVEATNLVLMVIPAMQFVLVAFMVFLLDKFKPAEYNGIKFPKRRFRLPDYFVWFFIFFATLAVIDNESLKAISYSGLIIMTSLYFFQGVDLFNILFDRLRISLFLRAIVYIICYTEMAFILFIAFVGLMSIWFRPKFFTEVEESDDAKSKS